MSADAFVSLPRGKGVAYHAQESWVLNDTIRVGSVVRACLSVLNTLQNNILFGAAYDEARYKKGV